MEEPKEKEQETKQQEAAQPADLHRHKSPKARILAVDEADEKKRPAHRYSRKGRRTQ